MGGRFVSRYNRAYFCTITSVSRNNNEGTVTLHITVRGDESLGELQRPTSSTLTCAGAAVPLTTEEVLEDTARSLTARLVYTCPAGAAGGALTFQYGEGGYGVVALEGC